jgi:hypothetical protein
LLSTKFGGRDSILSGEFNWYFANKLANPKFSLETIAEIAIIEFSVTQFGLERHLLNLVILRERENLENEHECSYI